MEHQFQENNVSSDFFRNYLKIINETDKDVNQSDIHGEEYTGYENSDKGPFECRNCKYSDENSTCGQSVMMEHSKLPKEDNGRVKIDPHGCCEYVDRKGNGE